MSFLCKPRTYFIDANQVRNQEYEYTHRRSMRSICWNLCTDFINASKFGAFSASPAIENSKIFRGTMPPDPPRKRSHRGSSGLWHLLGQNGENVLISDFQMLESMGKAYLTVRDKTRSTPTFGHIANDFSSYFCPLPLIKIDQDKKHHKPTVHITIYLSHCFLYTTLSPYKIQYQSGTQFFLVLLQAMGSDDENPFSPRQNVLLERRRSEDDIPQQLSAEEIKACLEKLENEKVSSII